MAKVQKTLPHSGDVNAFIAGVPDKLRRKDVLTLVAMMRRATGEKPVMWGTSIVGFGAYSYPYAGGGEGIAPRLAFSPRSNRLVLYLALWRKQVRERLKRLGPHTSSVSCLYLKTLADIDLGVLQDMLVVSFDQAGPPPARKRATSRPASKKKPVRKPIRKASRKRGAKD